MDLIVSPATVAFNTQSGAPKLALQPGQVIDALVLQLLDAVSVRLSVGDSVLDVHTQVPLELGSIVRLAVRGTGADLKLVILNISPPPLSAAKPAGDPSRLPAAPPVAVAETPRRLAAPPLPLAATIVAQGAENTGEPAAGPVSAATVETVTEVPVIAAPPDAARAVTDAIQSSAPRQSGLAPLLADAARALTVRDLPAPMKQALAQLFSPHLALVDGSANVSAEDIKQGFARSGLLLESRVAAAARGATPMPAPTDDLKAALLGLREVLETWIGSGPLLAEGEAEALALAPRQAGPALTGNLPPVNEPPGNQPPSSRPSTPQQSPLAVSVKALPLPYRGAPTTAQSPVAPSISADMRPHDIVKTLLVETEGALARQTLLQTASLPDAGGVRPAHADPVTPRWYFELPFATRQGMAIAQFEVAPDGGHASPEGTGPTWRARFSLDVEPMGPIHAQIAVTGNRTAIRLWAERPETTTALRENAPDLADALRQTDLDPGHVMVRHGSPPRLGGEAAPAGRFLDRAS